MFMHESGRLKADGALVLLVGKLCKSAAEFFVVAVTISVFMNNKCGM